MRNASSRLFVLVLAVVVLVTTTGCGTRLWPFGRKPRIDDGFNPATLQDTTDLGPIPTARPDSGGWVPIGTDMSMKSGAIVPVNDQRLAGLVVYFAYDSSSIGTSERPKLEALARYLQENAGYAVVVEGHCDERGSDEYNRGLGERRALAVRDYLVSLGIGDGRIDTMSYGEEQLAVPNAVSEADHGRNRRAEFVVGVRQ